MEQLYIIAGLGNPGKQFENTRHNIGFEVIDELSRRWNINVSKIKFKGLCGEGNVESNKVLLLKPQTYMNLSGESIREAVNWYKVPISNLIVIFDDIDLPPGKIRVRPSGSAGTHNGMKSVIYQLQDDSFPRIKIGIGANPDYMDLADYVLGKFTPDERKTIDKSLLAACDAVQCILKYGINDAMNKFNRKS